MLLVIASSSLRYVMTSDSKRSQLKRQHSSLTSDGSAQSSRSIDDTSSLSLSSPSSSSSSSRIQSLTRVGNQSLVLHKSLIDMTDSTADFKSERFDVLRHRLDVEGFIFVRGVIPTVPVMKARGSFISHLRSLQAMGLEAPMDDSTQGSAASTANKKPRHAGASNSSPIKQAGWVVDAETGGNDDDREKDDRSIADWKVIGNSQAMTDVYNGPSLKSFFARLFAADGGRGNSSASHTALTSVTWLRAKGTNEVTAEHVDYYYFKDETDIFSKHWQSEAASSSSSSSPLSSTCSCGEPDDAKSISCSLCRSRFHYRCTTPAVKRAPSDGEWHCQRCSNLPFPFWTCWISLGDIAATDSRLAVLPRSHKLGGYDKPRVKKLLPGGYTKAYEKAAVWQTPSSIGMGDIILFNIKTIHAATKNNSDKYRFSIDTRVTTNVKR